MLQISDNSDADVDQAMLGFQEGDPVKAIILTVDFERKRISFGLKPSYFADDDLEMNDAEQSSHDEEGAAIVEEDGNKELSDSDDDDVEAHLAFFLSYSVN